MKKLHFKIIVPVYNAEKWISKNIKSIQSQDYTNYEVVIVDDCSTDNTHGVALELIENNKQFTLIRNRKNGGPMSSLIIGTKAARAKDEDVILRVDGDDWLARTDALSIIKKTYDTKNCLMTYGSYLYDPILPDRKGSSWGGGGATLTWSKDCIIKNNFREEMWVFPCPVTYKYDLWKRIKDSDFRDIDGEYYSVASDVALVFPILEMAGSRQAVIEEILYIYNHNNPASDFKINKKLVGEVGARIERKKKYTPIINDEDNNVFLYWIGKEYTLIEILRDLIYHHSNDLKNYKIHFITPDNIDDYVEVPSYFYNMSPNHQSNFVRVKVIRKYGGIWLDGDTIVMDSLSSLFDIMNTQDGFFIQENNEHCLNIDFPPVDVKFKRRLCDGVFGSKKETPLMIEWEKRIDVLLENKQPITDHSLEWNEIGMDILHNLSTDKETNYIKDYVIFHGLDNMYPVNWDVCVEEYIKKPYENYKSILRDYQPLVILVHFAYKELEHYSKEEILNLEIPLTYFLNRSKEVTYTHDFLQE